jgi:predicted amidohydrolase YtcJ
MHIRSLAAAIAVFLVTCPATAQEADLILTNGRIWTGESDSPWAQEVAVRGNRILAVGQDGEVARHRTAHTRTVDLGGRLVTPGFIDNHTHFDQAGALLLGVKLLDVAEPRAFAQHLRGPATAERMARLGVIAEVQLYHAIDDMRWMGERIGQERLRWTYAFRTLHDAGVRLSFGSSIPAFYTVANSDVQCAQRLAPSGMVKRQ